MTLATLQGTVKTGKLKMNHSMKSVKVFFKTVSASARYYNWLFIVYDCYNINSPLEYTKH